MGADAKQAVRVVLLQRHVQELLKQVHDDDTAAAGALLDVGDKSTAALDGVPLGKLELRAPLASVKVVDRPALLDWIEQVHPDWLQPAPDVEPLKAALLEAHSWPAAQVDSVRIIVDAAQQHLTELLRVPAVRLREGVESGLLDNVKANGGQRVDPETGEIEDVPGIAYDPGQPKPFVSLDRKNGGPEAVKALLTGGGLPALTTGVES